jgi:hypothetical protein
MGCCPNSQLISAKKQPISVDQNFSLCGAQITRNKTNSVGSSTNSQVFQPLIPPTAIPMPAAHSLKWLSLHPCFCNKFQIIIPWQISSCCRAATLLFCCLALPCCLAAVSVFLAVLLSCFLAAVLLSCDLAILLSCCLAVSLLAVSVLLSCCLAACCLGLAVLLSCCLAVVVLMCVRSDWKFLWVFYLQCLLVRKKFELRENVNFCAAMCLFSWRKRHLTCVSARVEQFNVRHLWGSEFLVDVLEFVRRFDEWSEIRQ